MVGLSVLLESQKNGMFLNRRRWMTSSSTSPPQIVNQTAMIRPSFSSASSSSSSSSGFVIGAETTAFLHQCFLCKRRLLENEDIYMYLGEMAFCSEDCRFEHMRTEADDGQGAEESNNGRSDQKSSSTSSPDKMRKPVVKHPVFSADCSPPAPKHEEKCRYKKPTNSKIAC